MRLFLLDDDPLVPDLVEMSLARTRPDWQLTTFSRMHEALEALRVTPPDLLLLDANLAEGSGALVLQDLAEKAPKTIIFTGEPAEENPKWKAYPVVLGVIQKPFSPKALADQIETLLHACTPS